MEKRLEPMIASKLCLTARIFLSVMILLTFLYLTKEKMAAEEIVQIVIATVKQSERSL